MPGTPGTHPVNDVAKQQRLGNRFQQVGQQEGQHVGCSGVGGCAGAGLTFRKLPLAGGAGAAALGNKRTPSCLLHLTCRGEQPHFSLLDERRLVLEHQLDLNSSPGKHRWLESEW